MPLYLVEGIFPGISLDGLTRVRDGVAGASEELTNAGKFVRFIRATVLPGDSRCLCLFEATDPAFAREAAERAGIPFTEIANAVEVTSA